MKSIKFVFALSALLSFSNWVLANQDGDGTKDPVLVGSVSDALSKKPVKGVTISITSSSDRTGKQVVSDAYGKFSIPKLPAGELIIVLEKKGYKTLRSEKIVVKEGTQMKLSFDISNDHEPEDLNLFHPLLRMMES